MENMGEARIKIVAMPKDTNPAGNIFGGWIMSQIDIAGSLAAREINPKRVVTVAVNSIVFKAPVMVGDVVSCYAEVMKVGRTSIQTRVEVTTEHYIDDMPVCSHVTSAIVTYVCVDELGNKIPLDKEVHERFAMQIENKKTLSKR